MLRLNKAELKVLIKYYADRLKGNPLDGSVALRLKDLNLLRDTV